MMAFLTALHDSAFSTWLRESESVWAFPTVLTVHTFGMMLLVPLFRVMWAAFWINLATGVLLFIADPERKATSLLFGFKMLLIIVNLPLLKRLERAVYREGPEPATVGGGTRQLAAASAALWAGTIFAGRLLGYM